MSRNVRNEEENVLHILEQNIPEERVSQVFPVSRRIFLSQTTYEVVEKAHIFKSDVIDGMCIALIEYDGKVHICMKTELFTSGILGAECEIENEDVLYGIGILLVNADVIKLKKQVSQYQIYDKLFAFIDVNEYKCQDIFEMFESYLVYEISDDDFSMAYYEDLNRILCMLLVKVKSKIYGADLSKTMFDILTLESSRSIIPMFSTILQTSNHDLIFLQLYRCIEYLYIIQRALHLGEEYDIDMERILKLLNSENIRYPEASSLRSILSLCCSPKVINEYYAYLLENLNIQQGKEEHRTERVSDYIYETRCKIAHFKYGQEKLEDHDTLNQSNEILCKVVQEIYQYLDEKVIIINKKFLLWRKLVL